MEKTTALFVWRTLLKQLLQVDVWKERLKSRSLKKMVKKNSMSSLTNEEAIVHQLGIELDVNWREYLPLLNDLHRVPSLYIEDNDFTLELKGSRRFHHTCSLIKHILEKRSKLEKIVILVEELQWIDEHSVNLICEIASEFSQVFVIFTLRILGSHQQEEESTKTTLERRCVL